MSAPDTGEAFEIIEEIESMASDGDLPDAGYDFAESVLEKAQSIGSTIEENGTVTEAQMSALENMRNGLRRWFRHMD